MKNWKNAILKRDASIKEAIKIIDSTGYQMGLVLNERGHLEGVVSDGDIRRAILRDVNLDCPLHEIMNTKPLVAKTGLDREKILLMMRRHGIHQMPLLNNDGIVIEFVTLDELVGISSKSNWVVLMAGGLGTRLMPLTENCPKPMLPVGGKPILESIIDKFIEQGFRNFFISVNYLADTIRNHFRDGSNWGINISYIQEDQRLGTAGAISLLPSIPDEPIIVMNGDLLTQIRFDSMLNFHEEHNSIATMAVREYDFQIPYGVVVLSNYKIVEVKEKPIQNFFVNAGVYVLSPEAISHIPNNKFFDMPSLFSNLNQRGFSTSAFPLREYWLDIGQLDEYQRAQKEWSSD